jgi:protein phosphatase
VTGFDQIEHDKLTDVGVRRSHNQDCYAVQLAGDEEQWQQSGHLFLVADGMGAHAVGEKASELAAGLIPHTYLKYAQHGPAVALRKSFVEANASIHACGQQNREFAGMGTTTTALLLRPEGAWVGHVGDSRAYRIRDGWIEQLSYDHSLVWEYARIKQIDPDQVHDIPANVIHRCLGPEPLVQIDVEGPHPLQPGDIFLLCSDGLSGQVTDKEIGAIASSLPPAEACRLLIDLANIRGGPDNITALIVRVGGVSEHNGAVPPPPAPARHGPLLPWWLISLVAGTLLTVTAVALHANQYPFGSVTFLVALAAVLAGLVGLGLHYQGERERLARERANEVEPPRIYRRVPCRIEPALLERLQGLVTAVQGLRPQAEAKQWEVDWDESAAHQGPADDLRQRGDLPGAFREYCFALLPLTRAVNRQRKKEEVFLPIWDKSP